MKKKYPPRPSFTYNLNTRSLDRVTFLTEVSRDYGDLVRLPYYGRIYLATHPTVVKEILVDNSQTIVREGLYTRPLRIAFGNGILILNGDPWQIRRKNLTPSFHPKRIEPFSDSIAKLTRDFIQRWRVYEKTDTAFDIVEEMMILTLISTTDLIFSTPLSYEHAKELTDVVKYGNKFSISIMSFFPEIFHFFYRKPRRSRNKITSFMKDIVQNHRENPEQFDDLITRLLETQNEFNLTEQDTLDDLLTLLVTGHETTGSALSWYWSLLSTHKEHYERTKEEVLINCTSDINLEISKKLDFVVAGFDETMRLYPPIWMNARYTHQELEIQGYTIPAKSDIVVSLYSLHRHPEFWSAPDEFNPNRFLESEKHKITRYSYLPFGAGPRVCLASSFALQQARIIIATILQHCDLQLMPNQNIEMNPLISLKPKNEIWMKVKFRS